MVPGDKLGTFLLQEFAKDLVERLSADFTCAKGTHYQDREESWFSTQNNPDIEVAELKFDNFWTMVFTVPTDFNFMMGPLGLSNDRISWFKQGDVVCKVHNLRGHDRYSKVGHISNPEIYTAIYEFIAARVCAV